MYNVYSTIVYSVSGTDVKDVIINGKVVMRNKTLLNINEKEVMRSVNKMAKEIKKTVAK